LSQPCHEPPIPGDPDPLVTAARAGSGEALGRLLEKFRQYLLLVANERLDSELRAKAGASDLVQETLLEAQRDFGQFHGRSPDEVLAWLRQILLNNLANFERRYRGTDKRDVAREVPLDASDSHPGLARQLAADTPSPSGDAIRREEEAGVLAAVERLPVQYRKVIRWRHQENYSFEEIGRLLDRSPDAARMLWCRAVELLRQQLRPPS
jgi:RNA polymerase sigma-70 factor (ECF subfamily)